MTGAKMRESICTGVSMEPFFSIVVVSLNAGARLPGTLESILCQRFQDYEIIIKDGGSTDGSLDALPADDRIRLFISADSGIYDAMNGAVREARGRYLYFLNCGDLLYDGEVLGRVQEGIVRKEQELSRPAAQNAVYYGDVYERTSRQIAAANPVMDDFACYRNLPCHQACFYSRGLFAARGFDTALRVRADYEHFLYCKYKACARLEYLPLVIARYEGGGFSETKENRRISRREHRAVTARYLPRGKRLLFRVYLIVTLQPLREKLAHGRTTAALYNRIKSGLYRRGREGS